MSLPNHEQRACVFPNCGVLLLEDDVQTHVHLHYGYDPNISNDLARQVFCPNAACKGSFESMRLQSIVKHLKTHMEFRYRCSFDRCTKDYAQRDACIRHYQDKHLGLGLKGGKRKRAD